MYPGRGGEISRYLTPEGSAVRLQNGQRRQDRILTNPATKFLHSAPYRGQFDLARGSPPIETFPGRMQIASKSNFCQHSFTPASNLEYQCGGRNTTAYGVCRNCDQ
jgi:hypothetical protein